MCELYEVLHHSNAITSEITDSIYKNLHSKLSNLIYKSIKEKQCEIDVYIDYILNLKDKHTKTECISSINLQEYLLHMPFVKLSNKQFEPYHVEKITDVEKYQSGPQIKLQLQDAINKHVLRTFATDFNPVLPNIPIIPYGVQETKRTKDVNNKSEKERIRDAELLNTLINLQVSSNFISDQILMQYQTYNILLECEKKVLRLLFFQGIVDKYLFIKHFPFLLEEQLINLAIKYLHGNEFGISKKMWQWLQEPRIHIMAIDMSLSLFSLSYYNFDLLQKLLLFSSEN